MCSVHVDAADAASGRPPQVTPHNPAGNTPVQAESDISAASSNGASSSSTETTTPSPAAAAPSKSIDGRSAGDDPAAEWLYLLFCRFVQEGLSSDVYDAVGIRAPGRPPVRHRDVPGEEQGGRGIAGDTAVKMPGDWHGGTDEDEEEEEEAAGGGAFFFPVTPEQLVVLNLAEIAAGENVVVLLCDALLFRVVVVGVPRVVVDYQPVATSPP